MRSSDGKFVPAPASGSDGSENAVAVLIERVDATAEDVRAAVIRRSAELAGLLLEFHASVDDDVKRKAKFVQLRDANPDGAGIIVRANDWSPS